jgi:hypothetical protein
VGGFLGAAGEFSFLFVVAFISVADPINRHGDVPALRRWRNGLDRMVRDREKGSRSPTGREQGLRGASSEKLTGKTLCALFSKIAQRFMIEFLRMPQNDDARRLCRPLHRP